LAWLRAQATSGTTSEVGSVDETSAEAPITVVEPEDTDALPIEPDSVPDDTSAEAVREGPRWVVFKPTPPNVSISVDGSPLKAYGPDFQGIRLKAGNHTFRFVGAEDCCEERVIRRRIPADTRDFELLVKLRYKPATLYLKGPAPANATVRIILPGNRTVNGRIREIFRIPMSSLQASAQIQIRAPGYRSYKSVVQLRAGGDLTEHSFTLETERETP
jgi:hypothetical protein